MGNNNVFSGCMPALMTPCDESGTPDFDALARKGKELVSLGMSAVVYCGSMGDWPLLTDEQRMQGVEHLVAAGVPVVVGTGAQNTRRAADIASHASQNGAAGLMLIPRVLSRGGSVSAQRNHFSAVLAAGNGLPAVIYNSPYYGYETRADVFFDLQSEHSNLVGFKEFGGAESLTYAAENIISKNPDITGVGNALPREVLLLVELCERAASGDDESYRLARELDEALSVLSSYDEGPDLVLYYKHLMVLEGNPEYAHQLNPADQLSTSQRSELEDEWRKFRDWWSSWPGANT
jgi:4-hydroxy-tetrahydrodipicolinate synthase